ncbi:carbon-nitrogen hydrolase family protein [Candidatus Njordibacter sp. Uisw_039]|jgi:predicted amidohydrolase|uniref:carbon-nitrogen hydrolase family protein n=1 Tax=Candidatus Njordibacter sp. Uisw_039 TaxID=3230972 RepID=UPI003A2DD818|tara:strand:+ start:5374 stop:6252 length:879 start_codon:yes stop_codon:yes gene_type:complete
MSSQLSESSPVSSQAINLTGPGPAVAVVQLVSKLSVKDNLLAAALLIQRASLQGAQLVMLPESFAVFGDPQMVAYGAEAAIPKRGLRLWLSQQAKANKVWLIGGTIPCQEGIKDLNKVRSSCFVYDHEGAEVARYDKIHMFDVDIADSHGSYRESDTFEAGDELVVIDTPVGKVGLTICYDLRFAEIHAKLVDLGAQIIVNGSAFTRTTGQAHWHTLLRARAIETQCYILAASHGGQHDHRQTFGHSMIIDPWGEIIVELDEGPGIAVARVNLEHLQSIRAAFPLQSQRRLK